MAFTRTKRRIGLTLSACDFCKHRKVRCSLILDKCKECHVRGLDCTFVKSKDRKCYLVGKLQEKHEWKNSVIVWSVDDCKKSSTSKPASKLEAKPSQPSKISIELRSRASELTLEEFKVLEESIYNSSSLIHIKRKLPLMVTLMDRVSFRFFINTTLTWRLFTIAKKQKPLTYDSTELSDGISYYSHAVDTIPFLFVEDALLLPVFALLDEAHTLSNQLITLLNHPNDTQ